MYILAAYTFDCLSFIDVCHDNYVWIVFHYAPDSCLGWNKSVEIPHKSQIDRRIRPPNQIIWEPKTPENGGLTYSAGFVEWQVPIALHKMRLVIKRWACNKRPTSAYTCHDPWSNCFVVVFWVTDSSDWPYLAISFGKKICWLCVKVVYFLWEKAPGKQWFWPMAADCIPHPWSQRWVPVAFNYKNNVHVHSSTRITLNLEPTKCTKFWTLTCINSCFYQSNLNRKTTKKQRKTASKTPFLHCTTWLPPETENKQQNTHFTS